MTTFVLDTLAYADTLKAGGFSEQQAATLARTMAEILDRLTTARPSVADPESNQRPAADILPLELKRDLAKAKGRLTLLNWMIGLNLAFTLTVVWHVFN